MPDGALPVYRDGHHAALESWRRRHARLRQRAAALRPEDWLSLPREWRQDLVRLEASVREEPEARLDAIAAADANLEAYEERLEDALSLLAQLHAEDDRTGPERRRRAWGVALLTAAPFALGAGWWEIERLHAEEQHAAHVASCHAAARCAEEGVCSAVEGARPSDGFLCAAASDADCERSRACASDGACRASGGRCRALDDASCERSQVCREAGYCFARDGACMPDDAHCRALPPCPAEGLCTAEGASCHAAGQDCAASAACKERGACTAKDGLCVPGSDRDCRGSAACWERGACEVSGGLCLEARDAACHRSTQCEVRGLCSHREDGRCAAASRADCAGSMGCDQQGECTPEAGRCVAASDDDCRRSLVCQHGGKCAGTCLP